MANKPTAKQQAWAEAYVLTPNATQAAVEAGYSKSSAAVRGHENLNNPVVMAEVDRLQAIRDADFGMRKGDLLRELVSLATVDIGDLMTWGMRRFEDDDGLPVTLRDGTELEMPHITPVDSDTLTPRQRRAIKSVSMSKEGTFKIELVDKMKPLEMLARHLGLFKEDNEQAGRAAAGTVAALIREAQGTPLRPVTSMDDA